MSDRLDELLLKILDKITTALCASTYNDDKLTSRVCLERLAERLASRFESKEQTDE